MSVAIDLSGKDALITGASQGLGAATARALHAAGCRVAINHPGLETTAADAGAVADELNAVRPDSARAVALLARSPKPSYLCGFMQTFYFPIF